MKISTIAVAVAVAAGIKLLAPARAKPISPSDAARALSARRVQSDRERFLNKADWMCDTFGLPKPDVLRGRV